MCGCIKAGRFRGLKTDPAHAICETAKERKTPTFNILNTNDSMKVDVYNEYEHNTAILVAIHFEKSSSGTANAGV